MASAADFVTPVTNLYIALFNRVPDTAGLSFWTNALANGASLETVTQGFLTAPEGQATYSPFASSEDFVSDFYTTVFGRTPDDDGLAFWTAALNSAGGAESTAARAQIVAAIIDIVSKPLAEQPEDMGDDAYAETVADRATFANKVELGEYFGVSLNTSVVTAQALDLSQVKADAAIIDTLKAGAIAVTGSANVVGTAGNDVITATISQLNASATRVFDGRGGNDTLNLTGVTNATLRAGSIVNIETVKLAGITDGFTVDAAKVLANAKVSVGTFTLGTGETASITGLTASQFGLSGLGFSGFPVPPSTVALTVAYAKDVTEATVELAASRGQTVAFTGEKLTGATFTGTGSVTVAATSTLTSAKIAATEGTIAVSAKTATAIKTIDASASTKSTYVELAAGTSFVGGSGDDVVLILATPTGTLDGGAGDDMLRVDATTDVLAGAKISNFEGLVLASSASGDFTATGFKDLYVSSGSNVTFKAADAGAVLNLTGNSSATVGYVLAKDTDADALTIKLQAVGDFDSFSSVTANKIETINIDAKLLKDGVGQVTVSADAATAMTVNVDQGLLLVESTGNLAKLTSFDASASTGGVIFQSANATLGTTVTITGSATAASLLAGGVTNDKIVGGAGNDWLYAGSFNLAGSAGLDTLTGGDGADTFVLAPNANSQLYATITDFGATDYLDVSDLVLAAEGLGSNVLSHITLAATATLSQYLDAAASIASNDEAAVSWFQFGGDTYVVVDNNNAAGFQNSLSTGDQLVKLTGLVDLTAANHADGLISLAALDDQPESPIMAIL